MLCVARTFRAVRLALTSDHSSPQVVNSKAVLNVFSLILSAHLSNRRKSHMITVYAWAKVPTQRAFVVSPYFYRGRSRSLAWCKCRWSRPSHSGYSRPGLSGPTKGSTYCCGWMYVMHGFSMFYGLAWNYKTEQDASLC